MWNTEKTLPFKMLLPNISSNPIHRRNIKNPEFNRQVPLSVHLSHQPIQSWTSRLPELHEEHNKRFLKNN